VISIFKIRIVNKSNTAALIFISAILFLQHSHAQNNRIDAKGKGTAQEKYHPGENHGGGKIFWLDETSSHGLIAASADQSAKGVAWNPGKPVVTGANEEMVGSGNKNSEKITILQGDKVQYAAKLCLDFTVTESGVVYSDWYLPSKQELNLLYKQKTVIGGFNITSGIYWSSTESSTTPGTSAWEQEFRFGAQYEDDKDLPNQVRCIRKF